MPIGIIINIIDKSDCQIYLDILQNATIPLITEDVDYQLDRDGNFILDEAEVYFYKMELPNTMFFRPPMVRQLISR